VNLRPAESPITVGGAGRLLPWTISISVAVSVATRSHSLRGRQRRLVGTRRLPIAGRFREGWRCSTLAAPTRRSPSTVSHELLSSKHKSSSLAAPGSAAAPGVKRQCAPRSNLPLGSRRTAAAPARRLPVQIGDRAHGCARLAFGEKRVPPRVRRRPLSRSADRLRHPPRSPSASARGRPVPASPIAQQRSSDRAHRALLLREVCDRVHAVDPVAARDAKRLPRRHDRFGRGAAARPRSMPRVATGPLALRSTMIARVAAGAVSSRRRATLPTMSATQSARTGATSHRRAMWHDSPVGACG
jgi:hypothetical protein